MSGDRSKVMEPAEPFTLSLTFEVALVTRRSSGDREGVRAGPQTHKRHEASPQGVVV